MSRPAETPLQRTPPTAGRGLWFRKNLSTDFEPAGQYWGVRKKNYQQSRIYGPGTTPQRATGPRESTPLRKALTPGINTSTWGSVPNEGGRPTMQGPTLGSGFTELKAYYFVLNTKLWECVKEHTCK